jgi:hypothetical protein
MTVTPADLDGRTATPDDPERRGVQLSSLEAFAHVEEPGADALVGGRDSALIPEGGDIMVYGDGGAGKTSLVIDGAFHLASGDPWLDIAIARPVRVLLIENEGPRPLFRRKLRRKQDGWKGSPIDGRIFVLESPWARITLADGSWQTELADLVRENSIDVVIAGPVTRLGMDEAGTLQQVRDFMRHVDKVRDAAGRLLTVILVHHENKGGAISGAWEGAGDTLMHVEARGPGHTHVKIEKARWSSEHHGVTIDLAWADGDGFTVMGARDYDAEVETLLADGQWRTVAEIANKRDHATTPGIGAGKDTIRGTLKRRPDLFLECNGGEVGRNAKATVYGLTSSQKSVRSVSDFQGTESATDLLTSPIGKSVGTGSVPTPLPGLTPDPKSVAA